MVLGTVLWIALYGVAAVTAAVATFLVAGRMREPGAPAPDNAGRFAALAGVLWPLMVMGAAQVGILVTMHHSHGRAEVLP